MNPVLSKVDDLSRASHSYLEPTDACFFFGEYTARQGYAYSDFNQLIFNLKKPVSRRALAEYQYKRDAINQSIDLLKSIQLLNETAALLVPVPPSHAKISPDYDDRLVQILQGGCEGRRDLSPCELVVQDSDLPPFHSTDANRMTPQELVRHYRLDQTQAGQVRDHLIIFDDVLTTGSHFKAMTLLLKQHFPQANISGLFLTRRVIKDVQPTA